MTQNEDSLKLKELVKGIHIAMFSTIIDGEIHSRPMATSEIDEDGTIYFFTKTNSEKVDEIKKDSTANVIYADPEKNTYVTVIGKTELSVDKAKIHELWSPMLKAWFPNGPEDPEVGLLKFTPAEAEYWDNSSSKMVNLFRMAKAAVTGTQPDMGDHGKLAL